MRKTFIFPLILIFCISVLFSQIETNISPIKNDDDIDIIELADEEKKIIELSDEYINSEDSFHDSLAPIEKFPELKKFVEAKYPKHIYKNGIEGSVLIELLVSDTGTVDSAYILKSLNPTLDTCALNAVTQFVFTPAIAGGESVPVIIQYEYRFSLKEVVKILDEYTNFSGELREAGTKKRLSDAMVVLTFTDTTSDTTLPVPFNIYLDRIGEIDGQYLEEKKLVTLTDSLGRFVFKSLPNGPIKITVPIAGYQALNEEETIAYGEAIDATYFIERVTYNDYEVTVYYKGEEKEVSRRQLTINEVKKIPGLGGDAVKVVQALPGVGRPTFGSGQIIVRGSPTWDSQFYLDGVLIPSLYHLGGIKSTYNSDALKQVDFYPGGFGSRYGNSIAGVVEITGRKSKQDQLHGCLDLSFNDGSFIVEGPIKDKSSVMISARRSFTGEIIKFVMDNSDYNFPYTISPFYWDYIGRIDHQFNKNNSAFVTLFGSKDRMDIIYPGIKGGSKEVDKDIDRLKSEQKFHMGILGLDMKLSDRLTNSLRGSYTRYDGSTSVFAFAKWEDGYNMLYLRDQLSISFGSNSVLNVGADCYTVFYNMKLIFPSESEIGGFARDTMDNYKLGDIAAYVNFEWKPIDNFILIPSFRYDYYPELQHNGSIVPEFWNYDEFDNAKGISGDPSLRLTGRFNFLPKHTMKFAVGNYTQTPKPMGQAINEMVGDPKMPSSKAAHYVLGYEWQITDLIHADLQGYYNNQWDIPRSPEDGYDNIANKIWVGEGKNRMYGLELMLRHDQGERFFGWLAYTLSRTERWDFSEQLWVLSNEDIINHIQLVASLRMRRNWDIGTRIRYVTGKPETPVIGSKFNANLSGYYSPIYGEVNSERVDPFFQVDFRLDKKIVFKKWIFSLYLDIQNLSYFLYKSPEMTIYNYDYTEQQTISSFIIPALGFKAEF